MSKVMGILGIVSRVLIVVVLLVVTFLSLGTAYIMFAPDDMPKPFRLAYNLDPVPTPGPTATPEPPVTVLPGQGIIINDSAKIINLSGSNGSKLIRVTVALEFNPTNPKYKTMGAEEKNTYLSEFNAEVTGKLPIIDDVIITNISQKAFDELYTAAGKENLRKELLAKINERLGESELKLISVYFTEFVIS
jgi:flagellar protein FliL